MLSSTFGMRPHQVWLVMRPALLRHEGACPPHEGVMHRFGGSPWHLGLMILPDVAVPVCVSVGTCVRTCVHYCTQCVLSCVARAG
jgi:hypothetical protein